MNIHNWIFHNNEYTKTWNAAKREDVGLLFSDVMNCKVLRSKNIDTLCELINKTDGDIEKIKKINDVR